jgi:hypothetical protein
MAPDFEPWQSGPAQPLASLHVADVTPRLDLAGVLHLPAGDVGMAGHGRRGRTRGGAMAVWFEPLALGVDRG